MPIQTKHHLANCHMCGEMIECATCGNNCCNGGYGEISDGKGNMIKCPDCPDAYRVQEAYCKDPKSVSFGANIKEVSRYEAKDAPSFWARLQEKQSK